jgi:hypothetical protein
MARRKITVTRTFAPLHFEDLDPHRFEDLVRELIYDFRDWQTIEATGRSGSDAGFDVRAFERNVDLPVSDEDDAEPAHPMEGNRWMIQCKREKELGPTAVRNILADVSAEDPAYGYILAAAAVFSRESYDVFREELRRKGVMEFYLWGRAELEDMLHLPKNDRILFTFFGISLTSRRRSRTTELRSVVAIKNKLFKLLGPPDQEFNTRVLLRDVNDVHYPYRGEIVDFDTRPRWLERDAFHHHPTGFWVHSREYYAYADFEKKEWDFTREVDQLWHDGMTDEEREAQRAKHALVKVVWDYLPRARQARFRIDAFVAYDSVVLVDPEGDSAYHCPHIYAEFAGENGPYQAGRAFLSVGDNRAEPDQDDGWVRIEFFPKKFADEAANIRVRADREIEFDPETLKNYLEYKGDADTLYALDARYDDLQPRDIVAVAGNTSSDERLLRVTHVERTRIGSYLEDNPRAWEARRLASRQVGREIADDDEVTIVEVQRAYRHEWEPRGTDQAASPQGPFTAAAANS